ncbi:hypothetical protein ES706_04891 [subsurface metagenome]
MDSAIRAKVGTDADPAGTTTIFARLKQIVDSYLADGTHGLAALETLVDTLEATLGALDTAAATGAVSDAKAAMAYLKQLITGLALDGSAPLSYDYTKATVPGWLHGFHMVRRILFVVPEALASGEPNTVHNVAIKAELDKLGLVITITQADALTYPDYESVTLTVLGSPLAGTAWDTNKLAHIKAIFGLPVVCVDAIAAAYLKMGADGGNADTKTVLNAIANIEASILGAGIDDKVGLAAGANTVADAGVTFSTLDMSDALITEIWYGWETTEDNTDVLLAEIRKTMPDATPGKDLDGADVPGTLAFYGCAYSMDGLNTLGKAVLHLLVEKLLHSSTAGLAVLLSGEVGNLASIIGNRATPAAEGAVTTTDKLMAYIKQLVTELIVVDGIVDELKASKGRQLFSMDFWSDPQEEVVVTGGATTPGLPSVAVGDLPTNATIVRAIAMFKFRMVENTNEAANKLNGATVAATSQVIQVDDSGATGYVDAINFVDDQFGLAASTREGGDVCIGSIDIAARVDGNDTYSVRWLLGRADLDYLNFNDVQVGLRIWYSV